jgi:hypothetical protein
LNKTAKLRTKLMKIEEEVKGERGLASLAAMKFEEVYEI